MHANTSNMKTINKSTITLKMLYTKSKAIQQIKIEDIALSNTTCFESNTLKHYLFDKTAIIQIQYCLLDKKQYEFTRLSTVVYLPFELTNRETAADSRAYTPVTELESDSISKSTAIALGHCGVPAVGDNTVASGRHISIMDLQQRNKGC